MPPQVMQTALAHPRPPRRALTLVECLVASVLLAIGASAAMVAITAGLQHQEFAAEQRIATQLARQLLEDVAARTYLHPSNPEYATLETSSAQSMDGYSDEVDSSGDASSGHQAFLRSLTVQKATDAGLSALPGAGVAIAEVTAPSGQTIRMTRVLPAQ